VPELPEVETVRRGLERQTLNFRIAKVEVLRQRAIASPPDSDAFSAALQDCELQGWTRRGKYLIGALKRCQQDGGHWGVHLRMTGQFLLLHATADTPHPPACSHTRVRIWNRVGDELRFVDTRSFGQMWWIPPGEPLASVMTGLRKLGPEPFSDAFSASYLHTKLKGSQRSIKAALLDQSLVAGVGNIYADESLFAAGILPHTRSGQLNLNRLEGLRQALVEVLANSIGAGGTTFSDFRDLSGTNGNYGGMAWVYRRGGQPCRRCGTAIKREKLSGRSSHWCPSCQH
jgi:formamidopyrimidine-DNA glycosylase